MPQWFCREANPFAVYDVPYTNVVLHEDCTWTRGRRLGIMRLAARNRGVSWGLENCGLSSLRIDRGRNGELETSSFGHGEPIVLLPGLAGGWRLLAPLARLLARRNRVVLIGFRGDRQSMGSSGPQTIPDHARDVATVISEMGLERPTVLGVSYGAAVALEMAVLSPNSVGALILSGAEPCFRPSLGSRILLSVLERYPLPKDSPFINQFFNILHGLRPEPGPISNLLIDRSWETDQVVVAARLRGLEDFDVSERLWEIEVPSVVLAGSKDVVIPARRQRALSSMITNSHFEIIEGAGHVGFLTHAAEFSERIADFILEIRQAVSTY